MTARMAKPEHEVLYQELCVLVNRHARKLTPLEILAVASNMVGKLVAMQNQRVTTPAIAMEVVALNIEFGNVQVIDELTNSAGSRA